MQEAWKKSRQNFKHPHDDLMWQLLSEVLQSEDVEGLEFWEEFHGNFLWLAKERKGCPRLRLSLGMTSDLGFLTFELYRKDAWNEDQTIQIEQLERCNCHIDKSKAELARLLQEVKQ